jgi:hypothetical protein
MMPNFMSSLFAKVNLFNKDKGHFQHTQQSDAVIFMTLQRSKLKISGVIYEAKKSYRYRS